MPSGRNLGNYADQAKGWATGHVVLACAISAVIGFVLHALLF